MFLQRLYGQNGQGDRSAASDGLGRLECGLALHPFQRVIDCEPGGLHPSNGWCLRSMLPTLSWGNSHE